MKHILRDIILLWLCDIILLVSLITSCSTQKQIQQTYETINHFDTAANHVIAAIHADHVTTDLKSVAKVYDSLGCPLTNGVWFSGSPETRLHCVASTVDTTAKKTVPGTYYKYADFDYDGNNIAQLSITYYDDRSQFEID